MGILNKIDEAKIYCGKGLQLTDDIYVHQPTVEEIINFGEQEYFSMVSLLCMIPSDVKSLLWDRAETDWNKISEFEFFATNVRTLKPESTQILFGDKDFSSLEVYLDENKVPCLMNESQDFYIDEEIYTNLANFLRKCNGISYKPEKAKGKITKEILLKEDREKRALAEKNSDGEFKSILIPKINALMRYPGCPYTRKELMQEGIMFISEYISGAAIYVSSTTLLQGSYSGFMDTSKINKNHFDWTRSVKA